jgi:hypothetical protein
MAYTTINKPASYFNTSLWTGNDSTQSLSSFGFSPDLVWIKTRTGTQYHGLFDTIRGALVSLQSNTTTGDQTFSNSLTSFDSDGFTLGSNDNFNWSTKTYVGWSWRGSDSSAVSNTSGTITSTVSANTTSGFSISTYTGNATNGATFGHGLGIKPDMFIIKKRSNIEAWVIYNSSMDNTAQYTLRFDTGAKTNGNATNNNTAPTSSVITLGTSQLTNGSGETYVCYSFANIKGFSKFGSYTGNGSTDGTFVYTGFKPAYIVLKCSSSAGTNWRVNDNKRQPANGSAFTALLLPSTSGAELTDAANYDMDFLSNGFKLRVGDIYQNGSGSTYIYMAFAENPFVSATAIPTTAR